MIYEPFKFTLTAWGGLRTTLKAERERYFLIKGQKKYLYRSKDCLTGILKSDTVQCETRLRAKTLPSLRESNGKSNTAKQRL